MSHPVPTLIKKIRGTDQPCRIQEHEPQPEGLIPDAPEWMSERQKELWREVVESAPRNLLRRVDTGVVLQYVVATDLYMQAAAEVQERGYLLQGRGRRYVSPAVPVMNSQAVIMRQCALEMGFSPAARMRLSTGEGAEAPEDHWSQIAMDY